MPFYLIDYWYSRDLSSNRGKDKLDFGLCIEINKKLLPWYTKEYAKDFINANNFYILPNDIVFIPSTKLVKWNNVISLLTPSETLFKTYRPYIAEQDDFYIISEDENIISGGTGSDGKR